MSFIGETGTVFGGSDYESESPSAVNFGTVSYYVFTLLQEVWGQS